MQRSGRIPGRSRVGLCFALLLLTANDAGASERELTDLSLEELFNVEIVSVSKKPERRSEAAAAFSVLSNEDIRRTGATTIPDALRLVPGVHVARINSSQWVVSMRGFSNRFSNKLLVMADGRSIYTPLFAGVFWDVQNPFLDDIDRIEVVRGPGGTLWGANAVNGVINIMSKSAKDTQGGLAYASGGTEEHVSTGLRYGGTLGNDVHYRVYGRYFERDGGFTRTGPDYDDWWIAQGGFRSDWRATASDTFTLQGDAYGGKTAPFSNPASSSRDEVNGANLLGRWSHVFSSTSEGSAQMYYDATLREDDYFEERRHTFDVDLQHRFRPMPWDDVVWGLGVRLTGDNLDGSSVVAVDEQDRLVTWVSGFVQNEIALLDDRLRVSVGTKVEHNDFTGFEFQPSGRVAYTLAPEHTAWAAVSRAVRVPSRIENDLIIQSRPAPTAPLTRVLGSEDAGAEELLAYEIGYRFKPLEWAFFDIAAFFNQYDNLITFTGQAPRFEPPTGVVIPVVIDNAMDGETYGAELATIFEPFSYTRVRASYAYLQVDIDPPAGSMDPQAADGASPQSQVSLWSRFDLPYGFEADGVFRYVDSLPGHQVDSYVNLDVRVGRQLWKGIHASIVGQNLLEDHHQEFSGGTGVQRGVYGKVTCTF